MRTSHGDLRGLSTCTIIMLSVCVKLCKITIDFGFVLLAGVNGIPSLDTVPSEHERFCASLPSDTYQPTAILTRGLYEE